MISFKEFLDAAAAGEVRHDLWLLKSSFNKAMAMALLYQEAANRGLDVVLGTSGNTVIIHADEPSDRGAVMRFLPVHTHVLQMVRAMTFTAIHNEEALEVLPNGADILFQLKAQLRP